MRKAKELKHRLLAMGFGLALALGVLGIGFSAARMTVCAAGQATVTSPNGAKIRQEASTSSTMVGGAEKGKVLSVLSQVQGSDGYTWYQVQVNDTTTGYVRSDLVDVTGDVATGGEGTGTGEGTGGEGTGSGGEGAAAPPVEMTPVNPVSATVSADAAEIRDAASSAGQVLGTVPLDTVVTVTGFGMDAESYTWYQVSYNAEGTQMDGYMLSDYCVPMADLVPLGQEPAQGGETQEPPQQTDARYEIVEKDGKWLLVDNETDPTHGYPIDALFENAQKSEQAVADSEKQVRNQKIIIIVLVFLLVGAVAGIAFLVFKIRDMMDSAYFNEVENETLRRKNASGSQNRQKTAMHTVGPKEQQSRPAGTRPTGGAQRPGSASGQRPGSAGQRGERMEQDVRRGASAGQRPVSQGSRPAGTQGSRPTGRPGGTVQGARQTGGMQGSRPAAQRTGGVPGQRPAGTPQGQRRPEGAQGRAPQGARPGQGAQKAQPKNFMADDDEFDFEFLNYDGEEE